MKRNGLNHLSFIEVFAAEAQEIATRHLPGTVDEAIPVYRSMIDRYHVALMTLDFKGALAIQDEAEDLAVKLNGGTSCGIKAGPGAPCYVLEEATQAEDGMVGLWGQTSDFMVTLRGVTIRIKMDGMFGIGALPVPMFEAHAVDLAKPFISETGYRCFHSYPDLPPDTTPDTFVKLSIEAYVTRECKGKWLTIKPEYRTRKEQQSK